MGVMGPKKKSNSIHCIPKRTDSTMFFGGKDGTQDEVKECIIPKRTDPTMFDGATDGTQDEVKECKLKRIDYTIIWWHGWDLR